ncbi:hypothetical protein ACX93W_25370 [Paenibacillus sp. CAU 1782]
MKANRKHPALIVFKHTVNSYHLVLFGYASIITLMLAAVLLLHVTKWLNIDAVLLSDIWDGILGSPPTFFLVIGIISTPFMLSNYVANGITRKHFAAGMMMCYLLLTVSCGLLLWCGQLVGKFVATAAGEPWLSEIPVGGSRLLVNIGIFLLFSTAGWLIGTMYYRSKWQIATLFSVVAYILATMGQAVLEQRFSKGGFVQGVMGWFQESILAQVILVILIYGLLAGLNYNLVKNVPIKRKAQ